MNRMKALCATVCLSFLLAACGSQQEANQTTTVERVEMTTEETKVEETKAEETKMEEITEEETTQEESQTAETADSSTQQVQETESTQENKAIVVYFSCTGNTRAIAEHIASGTGADLFEIVAEIPYTDADLDYGDNNSRSTLEMNDSSVRPAFVGSVDLTQYQTVYIGYPIWWGEAPRILDTFVESYDFTDKTVIPFCTSASSGVGSSATGLERLAGDGNWLEGKRFSGSESLESVMEWVNGL